MTRLHFLLVLLACAKHTPTPGVAQVLVTCGAADRCSLDTVYPDVLVCRTSAASASGLDDCPAWTALNITNVARYGEVACPETVEGVTCVTTNTLEGHFLSGATDDAKWKDIVHRWRTDPR